MGTHSSKENSNLPLSIVDKTNKNNIWQSSTNKKTIIYSGWQQICRCSHSEWLHGISQMFGFIKHKFICNSELYSVCAPGFCSESLSRKLHHSSSRSTSTSAKSRKLREHFEYNHIPAMISSLQNYYVRGIVNGCSMSSLDHGDTVMLLVYSSVLTKTKFIIVDLKLNRYVCALGDDYNGLFDIRKVHAAWSIDKTQVIIRVAIVGGTSALDFYKIVKKEATLYRRIVSIDINAQFQFSPNHWSSRLALYTYSTNTQMTIINYNITPLTPGGTNKIRTQIVPFHPQLTGSSLSLMNVHTWSTYKSQTILFDDDNLRLLSLLYTPDSVYIILIFTDTVCHCDQTLSISYFDIYHSTSLQRLHRINTHLMSHICPWHMCRNLLTPIFSVSSSRMAFCTTINNNRKDLEVSIVVLPNEMNLKSICRRVMIDYLHEINGKVEDISGLLPYRLNQYIQYRPEYQ